MLSEKETEILEKLKKKAIEKYGEITEPTKKADLYMSYLGGLRLCFWFNDANGSTHIESELIIM